MILTLLCLVLRILDTFVLPITELVGELIISKALGFILITLYLWSINRRPKVIGIHKNNAGQAVIIGSFVVVIILVILYCNVSCCAIC